MNGEASAKPQPTPREGIEFALRDAGPGDFEPARKLYLASMKPLLAALDSWDAAEAADNFQAYYKPQEVSIVMVDGADVGWRQVSETAREVHLDQIHLLEGFRGRGIGSRLIRDVQSAAKAKGKPVRLCFVRGNRAISLYRRLGFRLIGEDATKMYMQWDLE